MTLRRLAAALLALSALALAACGEDPTSASGNAAAKEKLREAELKSSTFCGQAATSSSSTDSSPTRRHRSPHNNAPLCA